MYDGPWWQQQTIKMETVLAFFAESPHFLDRLRLTQAFQRRVKSDLASRAVSQEPNVVHPSTVRIDQFNQAAAVIIIVVGDDDVIDPADATVEKAQGCLNLLRAINDNHVGELAAGAGMEKDDVAASAVTSALESHIEETARGDTTVPAHGCVQSSCDSGRSSVPLSDFQNSVASSGDISSSGSIGRT